LVRRGLAWRSSAGPGVAMFGAAWQGMVAVFFGRRLFISSHVVNCAMFSGELVPVCPTCALTDREIHAHPSAVENDPPRSIRFRRFSVSRRNATLRLHCLSGTLRNP